MKNKSIIIEAKIVLIQLVEVINQLNYDEYTEKIALLSESSIGEHTRHIIEIFQQLLKGYESGEIDYDNRKRDILIQENIDFAVECIAKIIQDLEQIDRPLQLKTVYNDHVSNINSNYFRELLYNVEHCIHHQAIIKIALLQLGNKLISKEFGVAKSTIIYRKESAR